jgi:hypothetical protein
MSRHPEPRRDAAAAASNTIEGISMSIMHRLAAFALAATFLPTGQAAEGYTLWDDFSAPAINMQRWMAPERTRIIESGSVRFVQRDLGSQNADTGVLANSWGLSLRDPDGVTQMRAFVTVNDYRADGCSVPGSGNTFVQARIIGEFFNAGPSSPTSRINDVGAVVRITRDSNSIDPAGTLRASGVVYQCTTADCNYDSLTLGTVDLGTVVVGASVPLKVEWEPNLNRFNFYIGSGTAAQRVTYAVDDTLPPFANFRQIGTRTQVPNCLTGLARSQGMMDAKFDNFAVNSSAAAP